MLNDILGDARGRMQSAIESLKKDLLAVRTGRASVSLLDDVKVDYYGSQMPVNQLATLSAPEPRMITVQPWDKGAIGAIEKAIQAANLGVNPQNDGVVIRLPLPPLTEQRRKELVKQARKKCEDSKVSIRNVRRDAKETIEEFEKEGEVSKDEARRASDELQGLTDKFASQIDAMADAKEKDIMEF